MTFDPLLPFRVTLMSLTPTAPKNNYAVGFINHQSDTTVENDISGMKNVSGEVDWVTCESLDCISAELTGNKVFSRLFQK